MEAYYNEWKWRCQEKNLFIETC